MKAALIAGATGLVGAELLSILLEEPVYGRVTALVRRPLTLSHPKLVQQVVNFDDLSPHRDLFRVDDLFCCLGTTMRKAGSREAFARVDLEYPLALGRLAREAQVPRFLIVTSMGASTGSMFFYNRVKGQVEEALARLGFPALHIFRPSLLLGDRHEHRPGEAIGAAIGRGLAPLMTGPLRKYRPIEGRAVAVAMCRAAQLDVTGIQIYPSDRIAAMAQ